MVPGDKEGVVRDGADLDNDLDYQWQGHTLTVNFAGFESALNSIYGHEIGVGTKPKYDDVLTYTSNNIISEHVEGIGEEKNGLLLSLILTK